MRPAARRTRSEAAAAVPRAAPVARRTGARTPCPALVTGPCLDYHDSVSLIGRWALGHAGEFELLTLLAIAQLGDNAYGVTVLDVIEAKTSRTVTLGAIYKTLGRLESKGLVRMTVAPPTNARGGRRRKMYQLTAEGVEVVRSSVTDVMRLARDLPHELEIA